MKQAKSPKLKLVKETQAARKARVSSGVKFRSSVFEDKRRKERKLRERIMIEENQ